MSVKQHRRLFVPVAAAAVMGLALTGCTGDIAAQTAEDTDCAAYTDYGTFEGNPEVTIGGTIQDDEADRLVQSWADFQACTGITVNYTGTKEFEAQIAVLAEGGSAPDIGIIPQPGLLTSWPTPASWSRRPSRSRPTSTNGGRRPGRATAPVRTAPSTPRH